MNWAIGHGSSGGRCCRKRGKLRISTRTSSLLHSQKPASNSRSSSGVSRSEEKIVVGARATGSPCAGRRLRVRGFMAAFLWYLKTLLHPHGNERSLFHPPGEGARQWWVGSPGRAGFVLHLTLT